MRTKNYHPGAFCVSNSRGICQRCLVGARKQRKANQVARVEKREAGIRLKRAQKREKREKRANANGLKRREKRAKRDRARDTRQAKREARIANAPKREANLRGETARAENAAQRRAGLAHGPVLSPVEKRERSPYWRAWLVTLVFNNGYACLGVARLDGSDNPHRIPEAKASQRKRAHLGAQLGYGEQSIGLTMPEARILSALLHSRLNVQRKVRRSRRA